MSVAEDRRCQYCGEVTFNTVSFDRQAPMPWCLKPECAKKRNAAVMTHIREMKRTSPTPAPQTEEGNG